MNSLLLLSALVASYLCVIEGSDNVAKVFDYPWLAVIEYNKLDTSFLGCGGALISDNYVLTAGHCVLEPSFEDAYPNFVRLGEFDISNYVEQIDCITSIYGGYKCTEGVALIPIAKIILHPEYKPLDLKSRRHDIALVGLSDIAIFSDFIRPIRLPASDMTLSPPMHWQLIEAGWGGIHLPDKSSKLKLKAKLPYKSLYECQNALADFVLWQGQLCTDGQNSYVGDEGSPLVWENPNGNKDYELVGIVSFGWGPENVPRVYTKVYEYVSWINETMTSTVFE